MPRVYRKKKNGEEVGNYLVRIKGSDKSLGTKDKAEAELRAEALVAAVKQVNPQTTFEQVYAIVRDALVACGGIDPGPPLTLGATYKSWVDSLEAGGSLAGGSVVRYTSIGNVAVKHWGKDHPVSTITPKEVHDLYLARVKSGIAKTTAKMEFKILKSFFEYLVDLGALGTNPAKAVARTLRNVGGRADKKKKRPLTATEITDIRGACLNWPNSPKEWETLVLLGYWTALRLGDCVTLKWAHVDLANRTIAVKTSKTGKGVQIPMSEELHAHLSSLPQGGFNDPVMPELSKKKIPGSSGLSMTFGRILDEAKVDRGFTGGEGEGRQHSTVSFHSLRHTLNNDLAIANVDQEIRMMFTGHDDAKVNSVYTHDMVGRMKSALTKVEEDRKR